MGTWGRCALEDGEEAPPYLDRETYVDVTDQYGPTTDVTVRLGKTDGQRFAYLCVFNGSEWRPIHWGRVDAAGRAVFDRMGRGLLYLPATYSGDEVHPAAPPFFLTPGGEIQPLAASEAFTVDALLVSDTRRGLELDDEGRPVSRLEAGARYELFVWRDRWQRLGAAVATDEPLAWSGMPAGGLFWLVRDGSRGLERVFAIRDGVQVWM